MQHWPAVCWCHSQYRLSSLGTRTHTKVKYQVLPLVEKQRSQSLQHFKNIAGEVFFLTHASHNYIKDLQCCVLYCFSAAPSPPTPAVSWPQVGESQSATSNPKNDVLINHPNLNWPKKNHRLFLLLLFHLPYLLNTSQLSELWPELNTLWLWK